MSFNEKLQQEIVTWQTEGLISLETAQLLQKRYTADKRNLVQTLAILGSILLGVGIILFFSANWQVMSRFTRVFLISLAIILSLGSGYYLCYLKQNYPKVGHALLFLGALLYGVGVWLIGDTFDLVFNDSTYFLICFIGTLPLAYFFQSSSILFLASASFTAGFICFDSFSGIAFLLFPLFFTITAFPLILWKRDKINFTLFLGIIFLGLVKFVELLTTPFSFKVLLLLMFFYNLILYLFFINVKSDKFMFTKRILGFSSLIGLFFCLIFFSSRDFFATIYGNYNLQYLFYFFLLTILVTAFFKYKDLVFSFEDLPLVLLYLPFLAQVPSGISTSFYLFNNLILFSFTIFVIVFSYKKKDTMLFNWGLLIFAFATILKYYCFFFTLMPHSLFFMTGGFLLLFGSLYLERKRRFLLQKMGNVG